MKKHYKRIGALIISALLLVTGMMPIFASAANAEGSAKSQLQFNENGEFKILVFADIQDTHEPLEETTQILEASLEKTKPDLVVFLGDNQVVPREGKDAENQTQEELAIVRENVKKAIENNVTPVTKRNIPFAVVFGNHDHENGVSREDQMKMYQEHKGCLAVAGPEDIIGCGNYNLPILDRKGEKNIFNLWFIDSGAYQDDYGLNENNKKWSYASVRPNQIAWYEQESNKLAKENGGDPLPSMSFQHIIVPQVYDMLKEVKKGTKGAVRGRGEDYDKYYVLGENAKGQLNESPCPPFYDNGQFDSWVKQGDIIAAFFGHDHTNFFEDSYKNISLINCSKAGAYTYGKAEYMGARLITLHEDNVKAFETTEYLYEDLLGKKPSNPLTMFGTDYNQTKSILIYAGLGIAAVIILAISIPLIVKKVKRKKI